MQPDILPAWRRCAGCGVLYATHAPACCRCLLRAPTRLVNAWHYARLGRNAARITWTGGAVVEWLVKERGHRG